MKPIAISDWLSCMIIKRTSVIILFSLFFFLFSTKIYASSDRAYQDYLYQSDIYRDKYNSFTIAKNEYLKFNTLASETTVIAKTKEMLSQRSLLLRAYLLMLGEKLTEAKGMSDPDRQLYQSLITNEVAFLENHSKFVESVSTIKDAQKASSQLESHYLVLAISIRQIILGLTVSRLAELGNVYSGIMINAQILLNVAKTELPLERQLTLDRWFQKISDKRTIFLQKIDTINTAKANLKGQKIEDIQNKFNQALPIATQAKQDLNEGTSYIRELMNAMRYKE